MERKALGRGLSALIPEGVGASGTDKIVVLKINRIKSNPFQPRQYYDEEKLQELVSSIKEKGLVQPIVVRSVKDGYEVIAGERRLRALRSLGKSEVPAIIKDALDSESLQLSLIENIQRQDLNPIEEAEALRILLEQFNLSQEDVCRAVGKAKTTVVNLLRLLRLPEEIKNKIRNGAISMGHARAILALESTKEQLKLAEEIISKSMSVRELENLIQRISPRRRKKVSASKKENEIIHIEEELQQILGTRVKIAKGKKRGFIKIEFYSTDDLERLIDILKRNK